MPIISDSVSQAKKLDKKYLNKTKIPIVTVSGTYHEDLKGLHNLAENDLSRDIVLSRAHYSMAIGVAIEAWKNKLDPYRAWIVDPTNYVSQKSWKTVVITETIGKVLARYPNLKKLKDLIDKFGRQKLPILDSITEPLAQLTKEIKKPILSFHIATGNILLKEGKTVLQMVTDPHVRSDYLVNAHLKNAFFGVFDEKTRQEFLEKAELTKTEQPHGENVIVTGPPIDPRILKARDIKKPWHTDQPLKICLTTGGLGTNKPEIKKILEQLLPKLAKENPKYEILVYAGTQSDIRDMAIELARAEKIKYTEITPNDPAKFKIGKKFVLDETLVKQINKPLRIIYHPQIIDANELLIAYGFPWADLFITKPSGDMAYDAVASGAALLTLAEWGEWEHNVKVKFKDLNIAQEADVENIFYQLEELTFFSARRTPWIQEAQHNARTIEKKDKYFRLGAKNIIKAIEKLNK